MAKNKYYTVIAGFREPKKQLLGFLNKTNGQPMGQTEEVKMVVGKIQIPNYSVVWGRRTILVDDQTHHELKKKAKIKSLSVTDPDYKGYIEFLDYGDSNGEAIEVRYLPNSRSLDMQYQSTVQKLVLRDDDVLIDLTPGLNDFDETIHPMLVQFLKVHSRNGDSKSRNQEIKEMDFRDYDAKKLIKNEKDQLQIQQTALNLLFSTEGNDEMIETLADIQGLDNKQQPDVLFTLLMEKVKDSEEVVAFLSKYDAAKKRIFDSLNKAVDLKILDISQDGVISIIENKQRAILVSEIPSSYKGKGMFKYLTDDLLNKNNWVAIGRVKTELDKALEEV